jgi:hypothetical protein
MAAAIQRTIARQLAGRQAAQMETHHLLPKANEFAALFRRAGLDISKYTIRIPKGMHRLRPDGIHTGVRSQSWNGAWERFFEARGPDVNADEILEHLLRMMTDFGLVP